jgi:myo-inositol-1(or 4)-monophosphatase
MAARGAVHFAVAAQNSHDWDIAAADLVLEEAGGRLTDGSSERLLYNTRQIRRSALLGAPEQLAPRLLGAFRDAIGA